MRGRFASALLLTCAIVTTAAIRWPWRQDEGAVDDFVAEARAATQRYRDRQRAIDDGFTRVGVEFPAMGEHWVSFARILEDSFSAARPSVLIYAKTDSGPHLAGVAYTRLLGAGDHAPGFPGSDAWHEHNGAVDEESLPLHHGQHGAGVVDGPRLAILHAWIWNANPAGMFVTDNWALPLQRAHVQADRPPQRESIRAFALADDRDEYLRMVLRVSLDLSPAEDSAAAMVIARSSRSIAKLVAPIRAARRLSAIDEQALGAEWDSLWSALVAALPRREAALRSLKPSI